MSLLDRRPPEDGAFELLIIGDDSAISTYSSDAVELVNGLGSVGDTSLCTKICYKFKNLGYRFRKDIHLTATVTKDCILGEGVKILEGAVVGTRTTIIQGLNLGEKTLVGAGAVVIRDVAAGTKVLGVPVKAI